MEQLAQLRWLSVSHNMLSDPWELTPLIALPALTWLSVSPQRWPYDAPSSAGASHVSALYRRLVVLMTVHSRGSQRQAGLNFLDRPRGSHTLPLDSPDSSWSAISIDQRMAALEELYMHVIQESVDDEAIEPTRPARQQGSHCAGTHLQAAAPAACAGADDSWTAVRLYVLDRLARSASQQMAAYASHTAAPAPDRQSCSSRRSSASLAAERASAEPGQDSKRVSLSALGRLISREACASLVAGWLEEERQRACLFASIGQRVALDANKLGELTILSLASCCLSHVRLSGLHALVSLDLSNNANLRRVDGLDAQPRLQIALLERNPGLCGVVALEDIMVQLMRLHSIRSITLPFHLLDARTDVNLSLGARYDDWQQLTVGCFRALFALCPT